ncbi:MAG TPA: succinate dehydrogenase assembly factor 2 [Gammaproteobacteria bacterium]|nr:succinate dehydrogenase assembly factor 2 [Gammaproteobacteria bacterium]
MQEATESDAGKINRLAWQCRRGMRELDELLNSFLLQGYRGLDEPAQETFARLLEYPDAVLLELLMGRMTPADKDVAHIVRKIRNPAAP